MVTLRLARRGRVWRLVAPEIWTRLRLGGAGGLETLVCARFAPGKLGQGGSHELKP